jgi:APA family basic amino acid/polyamine antiporter
MAQDGLFFQATGKLNRRSVPAVGLILQGIWAAVLILPRTRSHDPVTGAEVYGNLYGQLLDYVIFAVLVFYVLTIVGLFRLRRNRPEAVRPYRAVGYPFVPAFYLLGASVIAVTLLLYKTQTSWPGLLIVLTGVPVYFIWKGLRDRAGRAALAQPVVD